MSMITEEMGIKTLWFLVDIVVHLVLTQLLGPLTKGRPLEPEAMPEPPHTSKSQPCTVIYSFPVMLYCPYSLTTNWHRSVKNHRSHNYLQRN